MLPSKGCCVTIDDVCITCFLLLAVMDQMGQDLGIGLFRAILHRKSNAEGIDQYHRIGPRGLPVLRHSAGSHNLDIIRP